MQKFDCRIVINHNIFKLQLIYFLKSLRDPVTTNTNHVILTQLIIIHVLVNV